MLKPDSPIPSPTPGALSALQTTAANEPLPSGGFDPSASAGELLRTAREKAGLSQGDIASKLRMGIKQVRALEQDQYAALPTGTFLRGFVRNFAKAVGVAPDVALRLLAQTHQEAVALDASAVVMPSQQNIKVPTPGGEIATPRMRALIATMIAVLLSAVVWYWWEYVRPNLAEGGRPKVVAAEKSVSEPIALPAPSVTAASPDLVLAPETKAVPPATAQPDTPAAGTLTLPAVAAKTPESAEVAPDVPRPALPAGSGVLGFTFSGESWVEVVDRNGKTVLDKKFKDGDTEEVVGRTPFTVVIGNAKATRMAYDGKEIDLAPHTRVSVARVTVK